MKIKLLLTVIVFVFLKITAYSATCNAIASTNWNLASTWSCGRVPNCNDVINIPSGYTVTITTSIDLTGGGCSNTVINISGQLFMSGNTSRLELVSTATININTGGRLHTDIANNSQKIIIGNGPAEWDSNTGDLTGPWRITNSSSITTLPVELIGFKAHYNASVVTLNWGTASEKNNSHFILERSVDATEWQEVAKVIGSKNSSIVNHYFYSDYIKHEGIFYYRLSQVDIDGAKETFKIIDVNCKAHNSEELIIYPNPANSDLTLLINSNQASANSILNLVNSIGEVVFETELHMLQGQNRFNFVIDIPAGIYSVIINSSTVVVPNQKIVIVKS